MQWPLSRIRATTFTGKISKYAAAWQGVLLLYEACFCLMLYTHDHTHTTLFSAAAMAHTHQVRGHWKSLTDPWKQSKGSATHFLPPILTDTGHQVLADLIIYTLQHAAWGMLGANCSAMAATTAAAAAASAGAAAGAEAPARLPPPLQAGVVDAASSFCLLQHDFEKAVVAAEGFRWAPERPNATSWMAQKWAWRGEAPGQWAELQLDTRVAGQGANSAPDAAGLAAAPKTAAAPARPDTNVTIVLGYLRSYIGMGSATVECMSGCICSVSRAAFEVSWAIQSPALLAPPSPQKTSINGLWERLASLTASHQIEASQAAACRVRIVVLPPVGNTTCAQVGGCKVSLTSVAVSTLPVELGETNAERANPWD